MQSSIGQNFILFSAILAKGKLGTRRGTWSESNTGHGPCWPGFGAAYSKPSGRSMNRGASGGDMMCCGMLDRLVA